MRLIDADALKRKMDLYDPNEVQYVDRILNRVLLDIDNATTVYPDIMRPKWVPATERLPEKSGQYLVTAFEFRCPKNTYDSTDSPTERAFVIPMHFDNTSKLWSDSNGFVINALIDLEDVLVGYVAEAWTPMPEPHDPYKNK